MEILLTPMATATCSRCHLGVTLFNEGSSQVWLHTETLRPYCADAPMARPIAETIKEITSGDAG